MIYENRDLLKAADGSVLFPGQAVAEFLSDEVGFYALGYHSSRGMAYRHEKDYDLGHFERPFWAV